MAANPPATKRSRSDTSIDPAALVHLLTTAHRESETNSVVLVGGCGLTENLFRDTPSGLPEGADPEEDAQVSADVVDVQNFAATNFYERDEEGDWRFIGEHRVKQRSFAVITLRQGTPHLLIYRVRGFQSFEDTLPATVMPGTVEQIITMLWRARSHRPDGLGISRDIAHYGLFVRRQQDNTSLPAEVDALRTSASYHPEDDPHNQDTAEREGSYPDEVAGFEVCPRDTDGCAVVSYLLRKYERAFGIRDVYIPRAVPDREVQVGDGKWNTEVNRFGEWHAPYIPWGKQDAPPCPDLKSAAALEAEKRDAVATVAMWLEARPGR